MGAHIKSDLTISASNINGFKYSNYFTGELPITCVNGKITMRSTDWISSFGERYLEPHDMNNDFGYQKMITDALALTDFESVIRFLTKLLGSNPPERDIHLFLNYLNYLKVNDWKVFFVDEFGSVKVNPHYLELIYKPTEEEAPPPP